jgi:pyridoxine/pyridoxamine 5'-phosphate oxidase
MGVPGHAPMLAQTQGTRSSKQILVKGFDYAGVVVHTFNLSTQKTEAGRV